MPLFQPIRCNKEDMPEEINDGALYFCIDTKELFIDITTESGEEKRIQVSSGVSNSLGSEIIYVGTEEPQDPNILIWIDLSVNDNSSSSTSWTEFFTPQGDD